jgi:transposase
MTIMIGIDPHKATHTAVAIDGDEQVLDELTLRASKAQTSRLRTWASQFDDTAWAVESARGLGYLLSQQLVAAGETRRRKLTGAGQDARGGEDGVERSGELAS